MQTIGPASDTVQNLVKTRTDGRGSSPGPALIGWRWWLACSLVLAGTLVATIPTTGDIGLTWDEPAYRFSQLRSAEWWRRLAHVQSRADLDALLDSDALLYYWTYARHGINFHPPLAGQLNLLTHSVFGGWMKDIPARRMASVIEFALTITIGFGFMARRYGTLAGVVTAGSLLLIPRVYGDAHLATTDTPGLLLWAATALAFWKGLNQPKARRWRVLVGVLLGLAFVEKMAAVLVLAPLLLWLIVTRVPRSCTRREWRGDWIDGLATSGAMLLPLALAFVEILRLTKLFSEPKATNLFLERPNSPVPGAILAAPLAIWLVRRLLGWFFRKSEVWGLERPGLETWTAILAFAPIVGWLGNPAWWRETLPRLAHYYMLNTDRESSLTPIRIYYLGATYEYSLPWHNGWVLIAVTVPAAILLASLVGVLSGLIVLRRDRLPLFFLVNLVTIPIIRMFPTPAHDGVRLMLPTFFFLAAFAGWGADWLSEKIARLNPSRPGWVPEIIVGSLVLLPSAWQLLKIHPYELSYYNELIGGPRGASKAGFELTYWYDAFNPKTLAELNERLPARASVEFLNPFTQPMTFLELQSLGELREDIRISGAGDPKQVPYVWLLTHDSKATPFTRLLFAMEPWYTRRLDGLRVLTVAEPLAVARAYALNLMLEAPSDDPPERPSAPDWVHTSAPLLGRFWNEGLTRVHRPGINTDLLDWARDDPKRFLRAAQVLSERREAGDDPDAKRLLEVMSRSLPSGPFVRTPLGVRPEAIAEAARIVVERPDALRAVMGRYGYADPSEIGGPLDQAQSTSRPPQP